MPRGSFVSIEGIDGIGKSTQTRLLCSVLGEIIPLKSTREPGGTQIAEYIRNIILNDTIASDGEKMSALSELLLFNVARCQHMEHFILPNLQQGTSIICDRFIDSTLAYQHNIGPHSKDLIITLHELLFKSFYPDLTIILYVDNLDAIRTRKDGRKDANKYDKLSHQEYVSMNHYFLSLHKTFPERSFVYINAEENIQDVHKEIVKKVTEYLQIGL